MASARVSFLIGGVQKGGTTALATFLGRNPALALPGRKEAHVFDAPDFDEGWSVEEVNRRYARHFDAVPPTARLYGDATPIYVFHSRLIARVARYNPDMRGFPLSNGTGPWSGHLATVAGHVAGALAPAWSR